MNILFVLRSLNIGGLEVVTAVLANKFQQEGHNVCVFAFETRTGKVIERFSDKIKLFIGHNYKISNENSAALHKILVEQNIHIIINQWSLPLIPIIIINRARKGLNIKLISVYHNDPLMNGRVQEIDMDLDKTQNLIKRTILQLKRFCYRTITGYSMRYIYNHSDLFEVLSNSYVSHFKFFTKLNNVDKLVVQTNPITINNKGYSYDHSSKLKEVIFVGRLDYTSKRVFRALELWALIEDIFPDWCFKIIGDGPERDSLNSMIEDLELKRVSIEGFQDPVPYYCQASILILVSEFEGFPLVLAECMSFGVVPIVYGSFSSVYDIIEDGKDGLIIPKTSKGFNAAVMAERLTCLIRDESLRNKMALSAKRKSQNFSIDKIYMEWINVFNML